MQQSGYTKWSSSWGLWRLNGFEHDHGEEDANFCLQRMPEFGHEGEEDAAGEGKSLWDGRGAVLQQAEAQVLLDG